MLGDFGNRLYRGETAVGFVGRRRVWYSVSAALLLVTALGLGIRGLDFGVEFTGGTVVTFQPRESNVTSSEVEQTTRSAADVDRVVAREVADGRWRVQTERLEPGRISALQSGLGREFGVAPNSVSPQVVGPSWGQQISQKALLSLGVFLALVVVYLSIAFEWKMALAAIAALLHDLALAAGVYAIVGFEVTPASVIGMLTILGYSLYDTVVVFDKVRENTAGLLSGSRMTYSQAANLSVNQVLVRSINTSVTSLLVIGAILFVGAGLLGAGVLKELALVLFVGIAAGTYSSIFLATPLLAELKEREPQMQALARRVAARRGGANANRAAATPAGSAPASSAPAGTAAEPAEPAAPADTDAAPSRNGPSGAGTAGGSVQETGRQQPRRGSKRRPSGKRKQ